MSGKKAIGIPLPGARGKYFDLSVETLEPVTRAIIPRQFVPPTSPALGQTPGLMHPARNDSDDCRDFPARMIRQSVNYAGVGPVWWHVSCDSVIRQFKETVFNGVFD